MHFVKFIHIKKNYSGKKSDYHVKKKEENSVFQYVSYHDCCYWAK